MFFHSCAEPRAWQVAPAPDVDVVLSCTDAEQMAQMYQKLREGREKQNKTKYTKK